MNLRRPQVKLRAPRMNVRAPKFVTDVARDLRDRHLLIPVIALLVAIVAVPVALKSSAEPAPPPPPAGDALDGSATQPAVLAESVTVRDYRERLDALKSKNPFRQTFSAPKIGEGQQIAGLDDPLTTGTTPAPTGTTSDPAATSSSGTTTSSTGSTNSGSNTSSEPKPDTITRFVARRIDILVGPEGSETERNGVEQLTLLPSKSKPVVAFLGVSESGGKAVFLVSNDVSSTSGEGSCFPSQSSCEYLVLREGQSRTFDYTPDGVTYKLKLRKIRDVKLSKAPGVSIP
jgi:hypothetical protein